MLADSRVSALVTSASLAQKIWSIIDRLPHLKTVILVDAAETTSPLSRAGRCICSKISSPLPMICPVTADTVSDEVAFWLCTSGSTGDPKGVRHVHSSLMATARSFGQAVLGIREDDVVHSAAKLFFAYGLGDAVTFPLSVGATAVLWPGRPSAR